MRILVIEDQQKTASMIQKALQADGHVVDTLADGEMAWEAVRRTPFDVIILDIMLPGRDGLSLLKGWRQHLITTPVLLLSARGDTTEKVEGLDAGADDYMPKPFALEELAARVRALGRRHQGPKSGLLAVADLTLNPATRSVKRAGRTLDLSPREFLLLEFLMRSAGRICSRMLIVEKVWNYDFDPGSNLVDVYVKRLRMKVDQGSELKLIHTIRGIGYTLKQTP